MEHHCSTIAKMLIGKIISEQTLKSAAQSVLDEIKRAYDDKFENTDSEREDLTLIVRVFDPNIKNRLINIENYISQLNSSSNSNINNNPLGDEIRFIETPTNVLDTLNTLDETGESSSLQYTNEYYTNRSSMTVSSSLATSLEQNEQAKRSNKSIDSFLDKDGNVIPYINMQELDALLTVKENKTKIDEFCAQLIALNTDKSPETPKEDNVLSTNM